MDRPCCLVSLAERSCAPIFANVRGGARGAEGYVGLSASADLRLVGIAELKTQKGGCRAGFLSCSFPSSPDQLGCERGREAV